MNQIDNKTNVPLFAAVGALPLVVGGILWLANIDAKASAASVDAHELKKLTQEILLRTIRIEEQIRWQKSDDKGADLREPGNPSHN